MMSAGGIKTMGFESFVACDLISDKPLQSQKQALQFMNENSQSCCHQRKKERNGFNTDSEPHAFRAQC